VNVAGIVRDRKKFSENRMALYNKASGKVSRRSAYALRNALINYTSLNISIIVLKRI